MEAPCNGGGSQYQDIWYYIEGNDQTVNLAISGLSTEDATLAVYTGCPATSAQAISMTAPGSTCAVINGANGSVVVPTSFGTNYFIQIQRITGSGGTPANSDQNGNICATNFLPNGSATCAAAQPLPITTFCSPINWSNNDDGALSWESPVCNAGTPMQDVWYAITGTGTDVKIDISSMTAEDATLTVYTGCPTDQASANALDIVAPSCISITGASGSLQFSTVVSTTYYIQIQRKSANTTNDQSGEICAYKSTKCGSPLGLLNDFCENPAFLTKNAGASFSASTAGVFSPDLGSLIDMNGVGCVGGPGNIIMQNNSWYQFTASATSETFNFSATSCVGVQALVYEVTKDGNGCCVGLNQKSNCISSMPMHPAGSSSITATSLTVGSNYALMVDGLNGAECDFTISGWGAIGVLPIELTKFSALSMDNRNEITWITESEHNNDYFNLHRSFDGENFEIIATIDGAGNSTQLLNYSVPDYDIRFGMVYYQLEQVDFDGKNTKSQIIALNRNNSENGLVNVYPNPTKGILTIDINVSTQEGGFVRIEGVNGMLIYEQQIEGKGVHQITHDMTFLSSGLYFIRYLDEEVNSVKTILKK